MRSLHCCLLFLLALSLLLTGCWDREELNDRAIVLGWGMDKDKDGKYLASGLIYIPQSGTSSGGDGGSSSLSKQFKVFNGTGRSIMEAANQVQPKLSRKIFPGNRRMVVLGESLARDGLSHILDEYSRDKDLRLRADIIVVENDTAQHLLQMNYPLEDSPATGALKIHENVGVLKDRAMLYFMQAMNNPGRSPTLPLLSLDGKNQSMQIAGTAVFDDKLKMKYKLNLKESYYYFWLVKKTKEFGITVPVEGKGVVDLNLRHLKSKIRVRLEQGIPKFDITLKGDAMIVENETPLQLDQVEDYKRVKEALDMKCKAEMQAFLKHIQQEKTDIVGFNGYVHRKYPQAWRKMEPTWSEQFAKATFQLEVNMNIRHIGLTGTSIESEEMSNQ